MCDEGKKSKNIAKPASTPTSHCGFPGGYWQLMTEIFREENESSDSVSVPEITWESCFHGKH